MNTHDIRGRAVVCGLCVLAALCVVRQSGAQVLWRPQPLPFLPTVEAMTATGVPRASVIDAYAAYLDEYEVFVVRADTDLQRVREQSRTQLGHFIGVRDAVRANEVTARAAGEHAELVRRLFDRAKPVGADPEMIAHLDAVYALTAMHASNTMRLTFQEPIDISLYVKYPHSAVKLVERARAYDTLAASQAERRLAVARVVEELNAVGQALNNMPGAPPILWGHIDAPDDAWAAVVRAQYAAFREVEPVVGAAQRALLYESFLPRLLPHRYAPLVVLSGGDTIDTPTDLARAILRRRNLTPEQRTQVRAIVRRMIAAQRTANVRAIEQFLRDGVVPDEDEGRNQVLDLFDPLQAVIGLHDEKSWLPGALEGADLEEFGEAPEAVSLHEIFPGFADLMVFEPRRPDAGFERDLFDWVAIPDSHRAVVAAILRDGCECYDRDVRMPPPYGNRSVNSWEPETYANLDGPAAARADERRKAFAAAAACDRAMIESLKAALPMVSESVWVLMAAARGTGANPGSEWAPMFRRDPDFLRAAFEAPMSDASRQRVIAALAADAAIWDAAAAAALDMRIERSIAREAFIEFRAQLAGASEDLAQRVARVEHLRVRSGAAWNAAVQTATHVVAQVVTPDELKAWNACIRRMEWPGYYPDTRPLARMAETMLRSAPGSSAADGQGAPAALAAVRQIIAAADAEIQRAGDAASTIAAAPNPLIGAHLPWGMAMREWSSRIECLRSVARARLQVAEERVRMAASPGGAVGPDAVRAFAEPGD